MSSVVAPSAPTVCCQCLQESLLKQHVIKKKTQFHSSQIKTSAKNFSRTFMPKKGGSCSASSFKSWQASRLGDNGVFGGLLIVWQTQLQSPSPSGSSKPRSRFQALFPCCQVPAVHSLSSTLTDTSLCERT